MGALLSKKWERQLALGLIFLSVIGAISLAAIVHFFPIILTDIKISNEIQEIRIVPLLPLMEAISIFGTPLISISLTLLVSTAFYLASYRREALFALFTFIADGINGALKLIINRPRPSDTLITVYQKLTDSSFPSGHVVHYVVFFGFLATAMIVLVKLPKGLRLAVTFISLALIVTVSISRIYLGAHWATDVIGGYYVGYVLLSGLLYFYFTSKKD